MSVSNCSPPGNPNFYKCLKTSKDIFRKVQNSENPKNVAKTLKSLKTSKNFKKLKNFKRVPTAGKTSRGSKQ
jgi:hypothetical protein